MERKGENTARMKRRRVNETQEETIKKKKIKIIKEYPPNVMKVICDTLREKGPFVPKQI